MNPGIALVGLGIGVLLGMTGVGGGSLLTPVLIFLGIPPAIAIGSDLVHSALVKVVGTAAHWRQKSVQTLWVLWLAAGSVPGSLLGGWWLKQLGVESDAAKALLHHMLGGVLVLTAVLGLGTEAWRGWQQIRARRSKSAKPLPIEGAQEGAGQAVAVRPGFRPVPRRWVLVTAGLVVGVLVGMTSVGSGSLVAVVLLMAGLGAHEIVGTDLAHATLLVTAAGLVHWSLGTVNWALVGSLLIGSIPGVLLGSKLAYWTPRLPLKIGISLLLLISGLKLV